MQQQNPKTEDGKERNNDFLGQFDNKAKLFVIFGVGFFMGIIAVCGLYFREFDSASTLRPEVIKTTDKRNIVTATINDPNPAKKHLQSVGFVKPSNVPLLGNGTYKRPSYPWLSHNASSSFWKPFVGKNASNPWVVSANSKPSTVGAPKIGAPKIFGAKTPEVAKISPVPPVLSKPPVVSAAAKPNTANTVKTGTPPIIAGAPAAAAKQQQQQQQQAPPPIVNKVKQSSPIPVQQQQQAPPPIVNKVKQSSPIPVQTPVGKIINGKQPSIPLMPTPQTRLGGNKNGRGGRDGSIKA